MSGFRQLSLATSHGPWAHVLEHLLFARAAGLLGATVVCDRHLPYFANSLPFLEAIRNVPIANIDVPVYTVRNEFVWEYPGTRNGTTGYTSIAPRDDGILKIDLRVDYPGLGRYRMVEVFSPKDIANPVLSRIASVGSQGWPPYFYYASKAISLFGGLGLWQHHHEVTWPQDWPGECVQRFAEHRMLDLRAALELIANVNDGCLSADVVSVNSGHLADIRVMQSASKDLIRVG
jgi:hypothetical protein